MNSIYHPYRDNVMGIAPTGHVALNIHQLLQDYTVWWIFTCIMNLGLIYEKMEWRTQFHYRRLHSVQGVSPQLDILFSAFTNYCGIFVEAVYSRNRWVYND